MVQSSIGLRDDMQLAESCPHNRIKKEKNTQAAEATWKCAVGGVMLKIHRRLA
jgi:hypothetical protein